MGPKRSGGGGSRGGGMFGKGLANARRRNSSQQHQLMVEVNEFLQQHQQRQEGEEDTNNSNNFDGQNTSANLPFSPFSLASASNTSFGQGGSSDVQLMNRSRLSVQSHVSMGSQQELGSGDMRPSLAERSPPSPASLSLTSAKGRSRRTRRQSSHTSTDYQKHLDQLREHQRLPERPRKSPSNRSRSRSPSTSRSRSPSKYGADDDDVVSQTSFTNPQQSSHPNGNPRPTSMFPRSRSTSTASSHSSLSPGSGLSLIGPRDATSATSSSGSHSGMKSPSTAKAKHRREGTNVHTVVSPITSASLNAPHPQQQHQPQDGGFEFSASAPYTGIPVVLETKTSGFGEEGDVTSGSISATSSKSAVTSHVSLSSNHSSPSVSLSGGHTKVPEDTPLGDRGLREDSLERASLPPAATATPPAASVVNVPSSPTTTNDGADHHQQEQQQQQQQQQQQAPLVRRKSSSSGSGFFGGFFKKLKFSNPFSNSASGRTATPQQNAALSGSDSPAGSPREAGTNDSTPKKVPDSRSSSFRRTPSRSESFLKKKEDKDKAFVEEFTAEEERRRKDEDPEEKARERRQQTFFMGAQGAHDDDDEISEVATSKMTPTEKRMALKAAAAKRQRKADARRRFLSHSRSSLHSSDPFAAGATTGSPPHSPVSVGRRRSTVVFTNRGDGSSTSLRVDETKAFASNDNDSSSYSPKGGKRGEFVAFAEEEEARSTSDAGLLQAKGRDGSSAGLPPQRSSPRWTGMLSRSGSGSGSGSGMRSGSGIGFGLPPAPPRSGSAVGGLQKRNSSRFNLQNPFARRGSGAELGRFQSLDGSGMDAKGPPKRGFVRKSSLITRHNSNREQSVEEDEESNSLLKKDTNDSSSWSASMKQSAVDHAYAKEQQQAALLAAEQANTAIKNESFAASESNQSGDSDEQMEFRKASAFQNPFAESFESTSMMKGGESCVNPLRAPACTMPTTSEVEDDDDDDRKGSNASGILRTSNSFGRGGGTEETKKRGKSIKFAEQVKRKKSSVRDGTSVRFAADVEESMEDPNDQSVSGGEGRRGKQLTWAPRSRRSSITAGSRSSRARRSSSIFGDDPNEESDSFNRNRMDSRGDGGRRRSSRKRSTSVGEKQEDDKVWYGQRGTIECRRASTRAFVRSTRMHSIFYGAGAHDIAIPVNQDEELSGSATFGNQSGRMPNGNNSFTPRRGSVVSIQEPESELRERLQHSMNSGSDEVRRKPSLASRHSTTFGSTPHVAAPTASKKRISYATVDTLRARSIAEMQDEELMMEERRRRRSTQRSRSISANRRGTDASLMRRRSSLNSVSGFISSEKSDRVRRYSNSEAFFATDDDYHRDIDRQVEGGVFTRSRRTALRVSEHEQRLQDEEEERNRNDTLASGQRSQRILENPNSTKEECLLHQAALCRVPLEFVVNDIDRRVTEHEVIHDVFLYIPFLIMFSIYFLMGRDIEQNHMAASGVRSNDIFNKWRYAEYQKDITFEMMRGQPFYYYQNESEIDRNTSMSGDTRVGIDLPLNRFGLSLDNTYIKEHSRLRREPTFLEMSNRAEWLRWLKLVWVPSTFDCQNPDYSEGVALRRRGSTPLLGAARLRVLRVKNESCAWNKHMVPKSVQEMLEKEEEDLNAAERQEKHGKLRCFSRFTRDAIDEEDYCARRNPAHTVENLFEYHECENIALTNRAEVMSYPCAGHIATIPFNATCNSVKDLIEVFTPKDELLDGDNGDSTTQHHRSIDEAIDFIPRNKFDRSSCESYVSHDSTRMVMLEYFLYSVSTDAFVRVKAVIEMVPGGAIVPNYTTRVFAVWSISRLGFTVFEFCFLGFVLYFFRKMLSDWSLSFAKTGKYTAFLMDIWNLMEACNLITLVVSIAFRWTWWVQSRSYTISGFSDAKYPEELDEIEYFFSTQVNVNAVNVVITYLKVLKYLRLNDRLNVLTRTLELCQSDLFAILVLFVFLHTGFSFCATLLYGPSMDRYKNLNTAFSTLMFSILGEFDYDTMRQKQEHLTPLFFWAYIFVGWILFLNFFIVILSEGFAQVNRTTTLQPIHVVVLRQIDEIRYWIRWPYLREYLYSKTLDRSRIALLIDVHHYLNEHFHLTMETSEDLHVKEDTMMAFRDLQWWVPRDILEQLGENFLLTIWEDIVYEYHNKQKTSSQYIDRENLKSMIRAGLDGFIELAIPDFVTLELQADGLETKLEMIPKLICFRGKRDAAMGKQSILSPFKDGGQNKEDPGYDDMFADIQAIAYDSTAKISGAAKKPKGSDLVQRMAAATSPGSTAGESNAHARSVSPGGVREATPNEDQELKAKFQHLAELEDTAAAGTRGNVSRGEYAAAAAAASGFHAAQSSVFEAAGISAASGGMVSPVLNRSSRDRRNSSNNTSSAQNSNSHRGDSPSPLASMNASNNGAHPLNHPQRLHFHSPPPPAGIDIPDAWAAGSFGQSGRRPPPGGVQLPSALRSANISPSESVRAGGGDGGGLPPLHSPLQGSPTTFSPSGAFGGVGGAAAIGSPISDNFVAFGVDDDDEAPTSPTGAEFSELDKFSSPW